MTDRRPTLELKMAGTTHVGMVRQENQDCWAFHPEVAVVADGMGGHADGALASTMTVQGSMEALKSSPNTRSALSAAHMQVLMAGQQGAQRHLRPMGSTGVAIFFDRSTMMFEVSWCGDSRMYLVRDGSIKQITRDHSLVQDLVDQGQITADQALVDPRRNIITHAIGIGGLHSLRIDTTRGDITPGDRFILCTDGLTNEVPDEVIIQISDQSNSAQRCCEQLTARALDSGARDNVTVVVVDVAAKNAEG